jgi:hypothetical protein
LVGTLSVTDADTAADALIFTTTDPDAPFFQPSPNPDFEIVNRNQLKTKRRIVTIGNMAVPIGVSDGAKLTLLTSLLLTVRTITLSAFSGVATSVVVMTSSPSSPTLKLEAIMPTR